MAYSPYLQPFGVMPNPMSYDPHAFGFGGLPYQPWPPGVDLALAQPVALAAAAVGNWLAGIVPPFANALMTPAFGSFPPVMQAMWPQPFGDTASAVNAIAFATAMSEARITNLLAAEGQVPTPLLTHLRPSGPPMTWQIQGADGRPVTATFHRLDGLTEDGTWLLQADVFKDGKPMSSQLMRVHEAKADVWRPKAFREHVAHAYNAVQQRLAQGSDARLAVVGNDGLRLAGAATAVAQQTHRAQEDTRRAAEEGRDTPVLPGGRAREDLQAIEMLQNLLGEHFSNWEEQFLKELPDDGYSSEPDDSEDLAARLQQLRASSPVPTMSGGGMQAGYSAGVPSNASPAAPPELPPRSAPPPSPSAPVVAAAMVVPAPAEPPQLASASPPAPKPRAPRPTTRQFQPSSYAAHTPPMTATERANVERLRAEHRAEVERKKASRSRSSSANPPVFLNQARTTERSLALARKNAEIKAFQGKTQAALTQTMDDVVRKLRLGESLGEQGFEEGLHARLGPLMTRMHGADIALNGSAARGAIGEDRILALVQSGTADAVRRLDEDGQLALRERLGIGRAEGLFEKAKGYQAQLVDLASSEQEATPLARDLLRQARGLAAVLGGLSSVLSRSGESEA